MTVSYLVCATERSGSTLLCEGLGTLGVAGRPEEYFEALRATGVPRQPREYFDDSEVARRLPEVTASSEPAPDGAELVRRARECGTTDNGVFGAKMMWAYLDDFLERFGPLPAPRNAARARALSGLFPGVRYVRVVRRDKVRQAISLWKAIQTASWRADESGEGRRPEYDRDAIDALVRRLFEHEHGWARFFEDARIEPFEIEYEELSAEYETTLRSVLDWLGIEVPAGADVGPPPLRRQADTTSQEWYERFTRERAWSRAS